MDLEDEMEAQFIHLAQQEITARFDATGERDLVEVEILRDRAIALAEKLEAETD